MSNIIQKVQQGAVEAGRGLTSRLDGIGHRVANEVYTGMMGGVATAGGAKTAKTVAKAVGGGVEGMIAGAGGGAIVGGIYGAVDDDESVLGGAAKGAGLGAEIGVIAGGVGGILSKPRTAETLNTYVQQTITGKKKKRISQNIATYKAGQGSGIAPRLNAQNIIYASGPIHQPYQPNFVMMKGLSDIIPTTAESISNARLSNADMLRMLENTDRVIR